MTNWFRIASPFLALALTGAAFPVSPDRTSSDTRLVKLHEPAKLRAECQRLYAAGPHRIGGYQPLNAFIDQLAKAQDETALRLIIAEDLPGVSHAGSCYAKSLGARNGVCFARTLKPCTRGWRATVWALSFSNAPEIRGYVRELASLPWGRGFAYEIDFCRGWGELVQAAWTDLDSTDRLYEGFWADATLGDAAREYLERFEKKRPIPPRKPRPPIEF